MRLGLIDHPDARKQHGSGTPLLGGLALLAIILPLAILAVWLGWRGPGLSSMFLLTVTTALITIVGMIDDRRSLAPRHRVVLGLLLFGGLAAFDNSFLVSELHFPMFGVAAGRMPLWLAIGFTSICCVGLTNAVNMADGKNGLVAGLAIGWLILIGSRASPSDAPFIAVMLSGLVALLVMNLRGLLFLGDGGAYGLAAAIGLLAIRTYNSSQYDISRGMTAEEILLLFAIPVIDSFRLTFSRMYRGRSPMSADLNHLHHHLNFRFGWPTGLYIYLLAALLPAAILLFVTR